jgi:hypothetical protein
LVWPTGGQSPFGNEQYQWAPALYLTYRLPVHGYDVTLQPLGRYYLGYRADRADAQAVRKLDLYPKIVFDLPGHWFVTLYPDRPLEYNQITGQWFIPFELIVGRRLSERLRIGLGWATKVAGSETRYRSLIEAQVQWTF